MYERRSDMEGDYEAVQKVVGGVGEDMRKCGRRCKEIEVVWERLGWCEIVR